MTATPRALQLVSRKPSRITITVSHAVQQRLLYLCDEQGRSCSNLAAYLLETALDGPAEPLIKKRWPSSAA